MAQFFSEFIPKSNDGHLVDVSCLTCHPAPVQQPLLSLNTKDRAVNPTAR